ncbi:MAG: helix-turn-helix domain-containing protein [Elusimicrobia bacterium]|nr:helix-turn-helix domain-containing protein [Elusimicrobiota bacterium]
MQPEDIVSTQEACRLLGITRPTLYSWIEQGKVRPWGKLGGLAAWFFLRKEVMKVRNLDLKYERSRALA